MPGPSFVPSILDCELLALTRSTHATPMFTLTDSASRPEISALDRAGPLEMQTHQKCPPRRISPLECTDTKNAPASPLECTDTNSLDLKSFRFHCYKKGGWGGASRYQRAHQLRCRECPLRRSGPVPSAASIGAGASNFRAAAKSGPNLSAARGCDAWIVE